MVRPEVVRKRLNKMDECLAVLQRLQRYGRDEFLSDPERYGSAERFLHLAIEALLDMGNHVIADEGLGVVDWYSDVPRIFLEKGLISSGLSEKWIRMIGFRNTLVHGYMDVDRTIVYEVLQNGLGDIEELKRVFARFL
jgi:uncharacterized protein YutE (UPF0331/DUF86 family)